MPKTLLIVESAKKARTIKGMLGRDFTVKATSGHILEMPRDDLHVDLNSFEPTLQLIRGKGKLLQTLKTSAAKAEQILLATDPDREGEAIAQHVAERLGRSLSGRVQRVAFNAITAADVQTALANPRPIDQNLVAAQTARRVIDRLVGYMASPVLWAGLSGLKRLSAGRVQSPALWLVVTREREIEAFQPEEWWSVDAELSPQPEPTQRFWSRLFRVKGEKPSLKNAAAAEAVHRTLTAADWRVAAVERGQRRRRPYPPFTTDSLQQAASSQLGYNPKRTMSLAQQLYEGIDVGEGKAVGLITYLRTDSVRVAPEAQQQARAVVERYFGAEYLPPKPPHYASRDKTAQDAHEAIRPTDVRRTPKQLESHLTPEQYRLYRLIWRRFVASQMKPALYDTMTVDIETLLKGELTPYLFRAKGEVLRFAGFLKVYGVDVDAEAARTRPASTPVDQDEPPTNETLPPLSAGQLLTLHQLLPKQHFTQPPPRYTEASLIGALKKQGLGRPSTYATIIETLKSRGYVQVVKKRLEPTPLGGQVCDLLSQNLPLVTDVAFTARMETQLDAIAEGELNHHGMLRSFYQDFKPAVDSALTAARANRQAAIKPPSRRRGKSGTGKPGRRTSRRSKKSRPANLPKSEREGQPCPTCGEGKLVMRQSRYGPFLGCDRFKAGCRYTEKV